MNKHRKGLLIMINRKRRLKMLLKRLETLYPKINFNIIVGKYFIDLIYDDKSKINDDTFLEDIFVICEKFLSYEELCHLATTYDLLGQMNIEEKIRYE